MKRLHAEQQPESSDFYNNAKEVIDDCFSAESGSKNINIATAYKTNRKGTITLEEVDSFVVIN